jgi:hypothetical protein
MAIAIAITLGIREQNQLACIFMLTWATQSYGFLTEFFARPKAYANPNSGRMMGYKNVTAYHSDPNVLYTISQTEWATEAPLFDPDHRQRPAGLKRPSGAACARWWPQTLAWANRMVPHIFGWFTMTSVWVVLIVQLENAKHDIDQISDRNIPSWVNAVIYGSIAIFMQFAFTQIVFQRLSPGIYFGTEIVYCILSLSAKLYLGVFLLVNVIMADASANDALSHGGAAAEDTLR